MNTPHLVVAHRGDPRGHVENTLAAVAGAVALGADAVEVDVRRTLDGAAVLHHDATLWRLHGSRARVGVLTRERLSRLAPEVPTLADALDVVRGCAIPLVLDVRSVRAAHAALTVVAGSDGRRARFEGLVATGGVWFCGRPHALAWVRRHAPRARIMLSWHRRTAPSEALVQAVAPNWFNPWHRLLDARLVETWRLRGVPVSTWTVDDADRRRLLTGWGVEAVITNDLRTALAERVPGVPGGSPEPVLRR